MRATVLITGRKHIVYDAILGSSGVKVETSNGMLVVESDPATLEQLEDMIEGHGVLRTSPANLKVVKTG